MPVTNKPARSIAIASLAIGIGLAAPTNAMQSVNYGQGWDALTFRSIPKTDYALTGDTLRVNADHSSSVIYKAVPTGARDARSASWSWTVDQSVPPTDLARKGGDDRNLAIYFVFTDQETAARLGDTPNVRRLLSRSSSRMLIYVHGGSHPRGSLVPSPYFNGRGTTIIQRQAGTGSHTEKVDLAADYAKAFGGQPGVLVGVAISADSDDSGVRSASVLSPITLI
ncbi:DUF3047 domain-containing protein [Tepidamorphus sp. 3E244]|uniref:DUF3047 domain-containing protein n=1 Tax=Tepidamorphus sp. 3E244 TaxID=3385498 RepID=UPI0038FC3FC3